MKALYALKVLLVSLEALVIGVSILAWYYYSSQIDNFAGSISLNEELVKYLILVPIGLAIWIANELRQLLFEDKGTTRLLIDWPDYWKLKLHLWISLMYAVVFVCLSIAPWTVQSGISTGFGLLLFSTSLVGQLVLTTSVYAARLKMKELLAHAPTT